MAPETDNENKRITSGKKVIDAGREVFVSLSNSTMRLAIDYLKRFRNPLVASRTYRYLARQLSKDLQQTEGGKALVFSSLAKVEINSEILLMFAYFLQDELDVSVLVVDATLRQTGVTSLLNLQNKPGFSELFGKPQDNAVSELTTPLADGRVSFLGAGNIAGIKPTHITENKIQKLLNTLKQEYDFIVLQQDEIQEDTRYLLFAKQADMVILHLEERYTPIEKFDEAKNILSEHRIANVKYILSEP